MVKNKTHKGTKKRIKVTGSGRLLHKRAFSSHLFTKKSSKRKRKFRKELVVSGPDVGRVKDLLGI